jgi:hypothetical protein
LVYHPSPAPWDEAIASIQSLADCWLTTWFKLIKHFY